jgi:hypothetical protein
LKVELGVHDTLWPTRVQAQGEVFEYIEAFYNGERRHSALAYLSPLAFERQWAATQGTLALSPPIAGRTPHHPSSIEAPGAPRTRGPLSRYPPIHPCSSPSPGVLILSRSGRSSLPRPSAVPHNLGVHEIGAGPPRISRRVTRPRRSSGLPRMSRLDSRHPRLGW